MKAKAASILFVLVGTLGAHQAMAVVVEGHVGFGFNERFAGPPDLEPAGAYILTSFYSPDPFADAFHALWFRHDERIAAPGPPKVVERLPSLRVVSALLGEPADWYLVEAGMLFIATTIAAGEVVPWATAETLFTPTGFGPATIDLGEFGDFYLGVAAPFLFGEPFDMFGWAHMRITPDGVEMLDNAVSYFDERGIIVGSARAIPEPPSAVLGPLLIGILVASRWRHYWTYPCT